MKRTRISSLLGLALVGAVAGFLIDLAIASAGRPVLIPPLTVPLTLVVVAALVIGFAIPIHRATKGTLRRPLDPFRAMRVVVLAKASSLVGALLLGASGGVLVYLLSRPVVPSLGSVWQDVAAIVGAIVLLVAGLVAEHLCTIPPTDDDDPAVGEVNHA
ncbi:MULTISPECIES: DUF3180 domain-containing protein [unclassified Rathayibacter]|uniref:DUF3180 domain-containing protein n=1 Tax=unclassified Rathayibacter TaxID=2609250 RepID=UPI001053C7AB|nr:MULTISPECIES: DUF3180 domain-containing protein [unclassified Rathayibacter]MCJ1671753.1 DUF3180 domain-containing protein [Rathayibacter sp. VKM Ac-2929]MCJ1684075.1 DUF3180 domain-containing protein [Rathayibacter sp. VKM Ac-2928]MCJ1702674.1 DUF3180 domain-containing protein [Rathayibacter sp. VKM Ac-2926]TCL80204.1 uncharacterized protein DUF3180 [Rathayibacter sp. PhB192]TCM25645.1 uncharacterized protein DUF3180 [Rathayibacter sp. PhB179]